MLTQRWSVLPKSYCIHGHALLRASTVHLKDYSLKCAYNAQLDFSQITDTVPLSSHQFVKDNCCHSSENNGMFNPYIGHIIDE